MKLVVNLFVIIGVIITSCNSNDANTESDVPEAPPLIGYNIVRILPHDTASFTQGLAFYEGKMLESTGAPDNISNNGTWIGPVDLSTGKFTKKVDLGEQYFGEGITILNDKIYQLTYREKKGFVYNAKTFKKIKEFSYEGEGWGLTNDGKNLIMSNGTSNLIYLDPDSLTVVKQLGVYNNNGPVPNLNELEYINGFIYVNQWLTSYIHKVNPATGEVVGRIDLANLVTEIKEKYPSADYLNGIAFDSATNKIYVTGKKWPLLYEIKLL